MGWVPVGAHLGFGVVHGGSDVGVPHELLHVLDGDAGGEEHFRGAVAEEGRAELGGEPGVPDEAFEPVVGPVAGLLLTCPGEDEGPVVRSPRAACRMRSSGTGTLYAFPPLRVPVSITYLRADSSRSSICTRHASLIRSPRYVMSAISAWRAGNVAAACSSSCSACQTVVYGMVVRST